MTTNNAANNASTSNSCAVNVDQTFSFSFGPAVSSPSSSTSPSLEAILDELTHIVAREKEIQARRHALLDHLDQLVEAGEAEEQIVWNDYKITRRTRKNYAYPEHIEEQRRELKAAEQLSLALGEAEVIVKQFWDVRAS